jgi:hypothetical protein
MSGGIGLIDCDNDGKLDIVMVNGSTVDRYRQSGGDPLVTLWHQDSDLKFTDITQKSGLARKGWGMGVAVADFDNDGNLDLFVTGYGGNALYRNKGNCIFEEVTDKAGVRGGGFSTGAAWADYDRDGLVDLFVSRYVHVDMNNLPVPAQPSFASSRACPCSAGPGAWRARPTCSITIAAMARSRKFRRKPASAIPTNTMAWARPGVTTIMTAGLISLLRTMRHPITFITTITTAPSPITRWSAASP